MSFKIVGKTFLGFFLFIALYLSLVCLWASLCVTELLDKEWARESLSNNQQYLLSQEQESILLTVEDPRFYEHSGIDISNGQGLTTITSSIARDIFLFRHSLLGTKGMLQSFYSSVFRCCKKIDLGRDVMAMVLNRHLSKEQQLQNYVNNTYMGTQEGEEVYGLPRASVVYYKKPLFQLKKSEFVGLVAMLKAPNFYHPLKQTKSHALRTKKIQKLLEGECKPFGWFDTVYNHCIIEK